MKNLSDITSILKAAEAYWRLGLPIIPLVGKVPALKDPFNFERTAASICHWFDTRACNIGLVTGDYVVIDSDTDEAERWLKKHKIDSPMVIRSGRGGLHRYFDGSGLEVRNWQRLLGINGLDGRGHGGFIVFPPSIHPETGLRYEFLTPLLPVEQLPEFRLEWITPIRKEPVDLRRSARLRSVAKDRSIDEIRASIRRTFAISGQGGHNATFAIACELAESGLSYGKALAEIVAWNETNAIPPWTFRALEHKLRDAFKKFSSVLQKGGERVSR